MAQYRDEVRDARGLTFIDDLQRDLRLALRTLVRTPGFTIIALITFALGIGANTAIFSVVNAVLIRPLPYSTAPRLVRLYETIKDNPQPSSVSWWNYQDWKKQTTSFESVGAFYNTMMMMDGDGEPERLREGVVTADVLPMLGVKPMIGRYFTADEEVRGKHRVVILSEQLWRRRFGADRAIVGKTISMERTPFTVIGVMPEGFNFPAGPRIVDLWAPFVPPPQAVDPRARGWHWLNVIAARKPGVTIERADQEMKQVALRIQQENPLPQANRSAMVIDYRQDLVGNVQRMLLVLLGAVFLVLLIACANVANLLLARNAARRKDVAVRIALGATRGQLARQFLTESVVLALAGALLGLGVSRLVLKVLTTLGPQTLPVGVTIPLDGRVMAALLLGAVLCGVAFGIAPALQLSAAKLRGGLANLTVKTTSGSDMRRFRSGLVIAQIALSLMLLIGAGLLMRGFVRLQATDPGLNPTRVLTARLAVPRRFLVGNIETDQLLRPLLEKVRAIPGVTAAGLTTMLPIDQSGATASFWVDQRPWPGPGNDPLIEVRTVSPGFLAAMGITLRMGRDFTESDDTTSIRKVIVNEAVVARLMPGERNPIGRRLLQGNPQSHDEYEIVGVAADVKQSGLDVPAAPEMYTPYADLRIDWSQGDMSLVIRAAVPELSILPQVRQAAKDVARDVALMNVRTMDEVIDQSLASRKLTLMLFGIFAAVALVLAASGLYGVIYYLVAQRTREFGIRVALGARMGTVVGLVMRQSAGLVLGGIVVGLGGALLLSRLIKGLVYGVDVRDPITFAAVPVVLGVVALVATLVPAWKATRVDPVIALREE
jgi:predicted permease